MSDRKLASATRSVDTLVLAEDVVLAGLLAGRVLLAWQPGLLRRILARLLAGRRLAERRTVRHRRGRGGRHAEDRGKHWEAAWPPSGGEGMAGWPPKLRARVAEQGATEMHERYTRPSSHELMAEMRLEVGPTGEGGYKRPLKQRGRGARMRMPRRRRDGDEPMRRTASLWLHEGPWGPTPANELAPQTPAPSHQKTPFPPDFWATRLSFRTPLLDLLWRLPRVGE